VNKPGPKLRIEEARDVARRAVVQGFAHVKQGVRDGVLDARAAKLVVPARHAHAHRFVFGLLLPFSLLRLANRDPGARASMWGRLRAPGIGFLVTTLLLGLHLAHWLPRPVDAVVASVGGGLASIFKTAQSCLPNPGDIVAGKSDDDDRPRKAASRRKAEVAAARRNVGDDEEEEVAIDEVADGIAGGTTALLAAAKFFEEADAGDASAPPPGRAEVKAKVSRALHELAAAGEDGGTPGLTVQLNGHPGAGRAAHHRNRDRAGAADDEDDDDEETGSASDFLSVLGALYALEWILIWIWREHHDAIASEVSALATIPSEPLPGPPKLRFDFAFLRMKGWRALRFVLLVLLVLPGAGLVALFAIVSGAIFGAERLGGAAAVIVLQAGVFLATCYWGAVFGAANGFVAWEPVTQGWEPWFLRALRPLSRIPILGLPIRIYAGLLRRTTRKLWPACRAFEEAPVEAAAMTVGKVVAIVPGAYLVVRPFFGPAATHLILARRAEEALRGERPA
jgi:hypothetical protein